MAMHARSHLPRSVWQCVPSTSHSARRDNRTLSRHAPLSKMEQLKWKNRLEYFALNLDRNIYSAVCVTTLTGLSLR